MDRRVFLWTGGCGLAAMTGPALAKNGALRDEKRFAQAVRAAEKVSGGRLGVAVLDTASGARFSYRGDERFAMCSTFKLSLAAAVFHRADAGAETLERQIAVKASDLVNHAPFAETRIGKSASVRELCEAAVTLSDNTAANLLLPLIGGPSGLTQFLRGIGDRVTRLDRNEPSQSESVPGDPRDTTSPDAMAATVRKIVLGDVLKPDSRAQLEMWLKTSKPGAARLRAGIPQGWLFAHKPGTGPHGTTNDVAIIWPPQRPPFIVSCYLTQSPLDGAAREAVLARIGEAFTAAL